LNILFLTLKTFSATGGIEKFNRCFSKALYDNAAVGGWQIQVLSAYDSKPDERYLPASVFMGFAGKRRHFMGAAAGRMLQADVLVFGHINLWPLVLLAAVFYPGRKRICMAHGREVWSKLGRLQKIALKNCDEMWCVSDFTAAILVERQGIHANKKRLFYNTLDPFFAASAATPASVMALKKRYGIAPGEKIILTVARLADTEKYKGYDLILNLLSSICGKIPYTRYVLCGKWDETEKNRIIKLINELKLHNVVTLTGFVPENELFLHYQLADVFVLPSRKEGFGIVFLEAAWCGLRVIGGNRDGSAEALLGGQLGRLVDPEQPAELQAAIIEAVQTPQTFQQQETQRQLVESHFGFDAFKKRQLELLEQAMR
jgi:phosphatidylinositol alpha-1,6-mannosyltransferase